MVSQHSFQCPDTEEINSQRPCGEKEAPWRGLYSPISGVKLQVQQAVIPEYCGKLICPKDEDVSNCVVNFFNITLKRYTSNTLLGGCYWKLHTHLKILCDEKYVTKTCCLSDDQKVSKCFRRVLSGSFFFFFFLITSIWLEPKILVFKVLCQVSDVRKDRSYKDLQEIAKILSDMANQTGDRWGRQR